MPKLDFKPDHLRLLLHVLGLHAPEAEVWAFGSRVNGDGHEGSDLDLVLRNPARLTEPQKQLGALRDALSESNIPILVDVLDWARIPEHFRREIERHHVVVRDVTAAENISVE
ncbi:MAG TPA: nucleotidyltransferase domain-containing protein [Candidatus Cybelea sp.]|jgi:predicted nucleotidyltransferase|nr:nucleotidyltransferase domain-containing protein [Candidatus Cybelea sp.]